MVNTSVHGPPPTIKRTNMETIAKVIKRQAFEL